MPLRRGPQVDGELSVRAIVTRFPLLFLLLFLFRFLSRFLFRFLFRFLLLFLPITIIAITPARRSSSKRGGGAGKSVRRPV
jgi:hypothetical protein